MRNSVTAKAPAANSTAMKMMTSALRYPRLTPQIEDIMSKATAKFKNDPYVKDYYQTAMENEARMNGLISEDGAPDSLPADTTKNKLQTPLTNVPAIGK